MDTRIILSETWMVVTLIYFWGIVLRVNGGDMAPAMTSMNFNSRFSFLAFKKE